jgi:hypothetical protein
MYEILRRSQERPLGDVAHAVSASHAYLDTSPFISRMEKEGSSISQGSAIRLGNAAVDANERPVHPPIQLAAMPAHVCTLEKST